MTFLPSYIHRRFFWGIGFALSFSILLSGCKKFIAVSNPVNELVTASVFTDSLSATAAELNIYSNMAGGTTYIIPFYTGLSGDELLNFSQTVSVAQLYTNGLTSTNSNINGLWDQWYQYIYDANAVLDGVQTSSSLSISLTNDLEGEAYFVRGFCYFYLVNLFGDVPLILSTDYKTNESAARTSASQVYQQVITDLKAAQRLLPGDFSYGGGQRIRPNQWAATAMLARAYLFTGDWADAKTAAGSVIADGADFAILTDLTQVFLANSNEAIWQLEPVLPNENTAEGYFFILTDVPSNVSLNPEFVNAFDNQDLRRAGWIDSIQVNGGTYYFPYKYKVQTSSNLTEYSMVLRLAEQYLIRAEAEARLNDLTNAAADVNVIRNRAGLANTTANDLPSMLTEIDNQRNLELFTEWGHRWLDLKRTGLAGTVLAPIKPNWTATDTLYPIPRTEIQNDPNLTQNPGY